MQKSPKHKKIFTRLTSLLLAISMLAGMAPNAVFADTTSNSVVVNQEAINTDNYEQDDNVIEDSDSKSIEDSETTNPENNTDTAQTAESSTDTDSAEEQETQPEQQEQVDSSITELAETSDTNDNITSNTDTTNNTQTTETDDNQTTETDDLSVIEEITGETIPGWTHPIKDKDEARKLLDEAFNNEMENTDLRTIVVDTVSGKVLKKVYANKAIEALGGLLGATAEYQGGLQTVTAPADEVNASYMVRNNFYSGHIDLWVSVEWYDDRHQVYEVDIDTTCTDGNWTSIDNPSYYFPNYVDNTTYFALGTTDTSGNIVAETGRAYACAKTSSTIPRVSFSKWQLNDGPSINYDLNDGTYAQVYVGAEYPCGYYNSDEGQLSNDNTQLGLTIVKPAKKRGTYKLDKYDEDINYLATTTYDNVIKSGDATFDLELNNCTITNATLSIMSGKKGSSSATLYYNNSDGKLHYKEPSGKAGVYNAKLTFKGINGYADPSPSEITVPLYVDYYMTGYDSIYNQIEDTLDITGITGGITADSTKYHNIHVNVVIPYNKTEKTVTLKFNPSYVQDSIVNGYTDVKVGKVGYPSNWGSVDVNAGTVSVTFNESAVGHVPNHVFSLGGDNTTLLGSDAEYYSNGSQSLYYIHYHVTKESARTATFRAPSTYNMKINDIWYPWDDEGDGEDFYFNGCNAKVYDNTNSVDIDQGFPKNIYDISNTSKPVLYYNGESFKAVNSGHVRLKLVATAINGYTLSESNTKYVDVYVANNGKASFSEKYSGSTTIRNEFYVEPGDYASDYESSFNIKNIVNMNYIDHYNLDYTGITDGYAYSDEDMGGSIEFTADTKGRIKVTGTAISGYDDPEPIYINFALKTYEPIYVEDDSDLSYTVAADADNGNYGNPATVHADDDWRYGVNGDYSQVVWESGGQDKGFIPGYSSGSVKSTTASIGATSDPKHFWFTKSGRYVLDANFRTKSSSNFNSSNNYYIIGQYLGDYDVDDEDMIWGPYSGNSFANSFASSNNAYNVVNFNVADNRLDATLTATQSTVNKRIKFGSDNINNYIKSTGNNLTFSSSDPSVASVNATTGVLTLKKVGQTKITVTPKSLPGYRKCSAIEITYNVKTSDTELKLTQSTVQVELETDAGWKINWLYYVLGTYSKEDGTRLTATYTASTSAGNSNMKILSGGMAEVYRPGTYYINITGAVNSSSCPGYYNPTQQTITVIATAKNVKVELSKSTYNITARTTGNILTDFGATAKFIDTNGSVGSATTWGTWSISNFRVTGQTGSDPSSYTSYITTPDSSMNYKALMAGENASASSATAKVLADLVFTGGFGQKSGAVTVTIGVVKSKAGHQLTGETLITNLPVYVSDLVTPEVSAYGTKYVLGRDGTTGPDNKTLDKYVSIGAKNISSTGTYSYDSTNLAITAGNPGTKVTFTPVFTFKSSGNYNRTWTYEGTPVTVDVTSLSPKLSRNDSNKVFTVGERFSALTDYVDDNSSDGPKMVDPVTGEQVTGSFSLIGTSTSTTKTARQIKDESALNSISYTDYEDSMYNTPMLANAKSSDFYSGVLYMHSYWEFTPTNMIGYGRVKSDGSKGPWFVDIVYPLQLRGNEHLTRRYGSTLPIYVYYGQHPQLAADNEVDSYDALYGTDKVFGNELRLENPAQGGIPDQDHMEDSEYYENLSKKFYTNYSGTGLSSMKKYDDELSPEENFNNYQAKVYFPDSVFLSFNDYEDEEYPIGYKRFYNNSAPGYGTSSDSNTYRDTSLSLFIFKEDLEQTAAPSMSRDYYGGTKVSAMSLTGGSVQTVHTSSAIPGTFKIVKMTALTGDDAGKTFSGGNTTKAGDYTVEYKFVPKNNPEYFNELTGTINVTLKKRPVLVTSNSGYKLGSSEINYVNFGDSDINLNLTIKDANESESDVTGNFTITYTPEDGAIIRQSGARNYMFATGLSGMYAGETKVVATLTSNSANFDSTEVVLRFKVIPVPVKAATLSSLSSGTENVNLTVTVTNNGGGEPTKYHWYRNNQFVKSTTTNTLTLTPLDEAGTYGVAIENEGGVTTRNRPTTTFGTVNITKPTMSDVTDSVILEMSESKTAIAHTSECDGTVDYSLSDDVRSYISVTKTSEGSTSTFTVTGTKPTGEVSGNVQTRDLYIKEYSTNTSIGGSKAVRIGVSKGTIAVESYVGTSPGSTNSSSLEDIAYSTPLYIRVYGKAESSNIDLPKNLKIYYTKGDTLPTDNGAVINQLGSYTIDTDDWKKDAIYGYYYFEKTVQLVNPNSDIMLDSEQYNFFASTSETDYWGASDSKNAFNYVNIKKVNPTYTSKATTLIVYSGDDMRTINFNDYYDVYYENTITGDRVAVNGVWQWTNSSGNEIADRTKSTMFTFQLKFVPEDKNFIEFTASRTVTIQRTPLPGEIWFLNPLQTINETSGDTTVHTYVYEATNQPSVDVAFVPEADYFYTLDSAPNTINMTLNVGGAQRRLTLTRYINSSATNSGLLGDTQVTDASSLEKVPIYYRGSADFSSGTQIPTGERQTVSYTIDQTSLTQRTTSTKDDTFVQVAQNIPTVKVAPSADTIVYGTKLSSAVFLEGEMEYNGTPVSGTFKFQNADDILDVGNHNDVPVTFTPSDANTYGMVSTVGKIKVTPLTPTVTASDSNFSLSSMNKVNIGINHNSDGQLSVESSDTSAIKYEITKDANGKEIVTVQPVTENKLGSTTLTIYTKATSNCAASEKITVNVVYNVIDWTKLTWDYTDSEYSNKYEFTETDTKKDFTSSIHLTTLPTGYNIDYMFYQSTDSGYTYNPATNNSVSGHGNYKVVAHVTSSDEYRYELPTNTSYLTHEALIKVKEGTATSGESSGEIPVPNWDLMGFSKSQYTYKSTTPVQPWPVPTLTNTPIDFDEYYTVTYVVTNKNGVKTDLVSSASNSPFTITATVTPMAGKSATAAPAGKGTYTCKVVFEENPVSTDTTTTESTTEVTTETTTEETTQGPVDNSDWTIVKFAADPVVYTYNGNQFNPVLRNLDRHYSATYRYYNVDEGQTTGFIRDAGTYTVTASIKSNDKFYYPIPAGYETITGNVVVNKVPAGDWSNVKFGPNDGAGYTLAYDTSGYNFSLKNVPGGYSVLYDITQPNGNVTSIRDGAYLVSEGDYTIKARIEADANHTLPSKTVYATVVHIVNQEQPETNPDDGVDWDKVVFSSKDYVFTEGESIQVKLLVEPDSSKYQTTYKYEKVTATGDTTVSRISDAGEYIVYAYITPKTIGSVVPAGKGIQHKQVLVKEAGSVEPTTETTTQTAVSKLWGGMKFENDGLELYLGDALNKQTIKTIKITGTPEGYDTSKISYTYRNSEGTKTLDYIVANAGYYNVVATLEGAPYGYTTRVASFKMINPETQYADEWQDFQPKWSISNGEEFTYQEGVGRSAQITNIPNGYKVAYSYRAQEAPDDEVANDSVSAVGNYIVYAVISKDTATADVPAECRESSVSFRILEASTSSNSGGDNGEGTQHNNPPKTTDDMWSNSYFTKNRYVRYYDGVTDWLNDSEIKYTVPTGYQVEYKAYLLNYTDGVNYTKQLTDSAVAIGTYEIISTVTPTSDKVGAVPTAYQTDTTTLVVTNKYVSEDVEKLWSKVKWNQVNKEYLYGADITTELLNVPDGYSVDYRYFRLADDRTQSEVAYAFAKELGEYSIVATIVANSDSDEVPEKYKTFTTGYTVVEKVSDSSITPSWDNVVFEQNYYQYEYVEGVSYRPALKVVPDGFNYTLSYTFKAANSESDVYVPTTKISEPGSYKIQATVYAEKPGYMLPSGFSQPYAVAKVYTDGDDGPFKIPDNILSTWALVGYSSDKYTFNWDDFSEDKLPTIQGLPEGYSVVYYNLDSNGNLVYNWDKTKTYTRLATIVEPDTKEYTLPDDFREYTCKINFSYVEDTSEWSNIKWSNAEGNANVVGRDGDYEFWYESGSNFTNNVYLVNATTEEKVSGVVYTILNTDTDTTVGSLNAVGSYQVTAYVASAPVGKRYYNAKVTIQDTNSPVVIPDNWKDVRFEKNEYNFTTTDGKSHEVTLINVPDGSTVTYEYFTGNEAVAANKITDLTKLNEEGTYTVKAAATGYPATNYKTYYARIVVEDGTVPIAEDDYTKVTFNYNNGDHFSFKYDAYTEWTDSIKLINVPANHNVTYKYYNAETNAEVQHLYQIGNYRVVATIANAPAAYTTYSTIAVISSSDIEPIPLWENMKFSKTRYEFEYDGLAHEVKLLNIPDGYTATYKYTIDGTEIEALQGVGNYTVTATIIGTNGNNPPELYRYITTNVLIYRADGPNPYTETTTTTEDGTETTTEGATETTTVQTYWSGVKFDKSEYTALLDNKFEPKLENLPFGYVATFTYAKVNDTTYQSIDTPVAEEGNYIIKATISRIDSTYAQVPNSYKTLTARGTAYKDGEEPETIDWKLMQFEHSIYQFDYTGQNFRPQIKLLNVPDGYGVTYTSILIADDGTETAVAGGAVREVGTYRFVATIVVPEGSSLEEPPVSARTRYVTVKVVDTDTPEPTTEPTYPVIIPTPENGDALDWSKVKFSQDLYEFNYDGTEKDVQIEAIYSGYTVKYEKYRYNAATGVYTEVNSFVDAGDYQIRAIVTDNTTGEVPEGYTTKQANVIIYGNGTVIDRNGNTCDFTKIAWSVKEGASTKYTGSDLTPSLKNVPNGYGASKVITRTYTDEDGTTKTERVYSIIEPGNYTIDATIIRVTASEEVPAGYNKAILHMTVLPLDPDEDPTEDPVVVPDGFEWLEEVGFNKSTYTYTYDGKSKKSKVLSELEGVPSEYASTETVIITKDGANYSDIKEIGTYNVTVILNLDTDEDLKGSNIFTTRVVISDEEQPEDSPWKNVQFDTVRKSYDYDGFAKPLPKLIGLPSEEEVSSSDYTITYRVRKNYEDGEFEILDEGLYTITATIEPAEGSDLTIPASYTTYTATVTVGDKWTLPEEQHSVDEREEQKLSGIWSQVEWHNTGDRVAKADGSNLTKPYVTGIPTGYDASEIYMYRADDVDFTTPVDFKDAGEYVAVAWIKNDDDYEAAPVTPLVSKSIIVSAVEPGYEDSSEEEYLYPEDESILDNIKFGKSVWYYEYDGFSKEVPVLLNVPEDGYDVSYTVTNLTVSSSTTNGIRAKGKYRVMATVEARDFWKPTPHNPYYCVVYVMDQDEENPINFDNDEDYNKDLEPDKDYVIPGELGIKPEDPTILTKIAFAYHEYTREYTGNPVELPKVWNLPDEGYNVEYKVWSYEDEAYVDDPYNITEKGKYYVYAYINNTPDYLPVENSPLTATLIVKDIVPPDPGEETTETTTEGNPYSEASTEGTTTSPYDANGYDWRSVGFGKDEYVFKYTGEVIDTIPRLQNLPGEEGEYYVNYRLTQNGLLTDIKNVGEYVLTATVTATGGVPVPAGWDKYKTIIKVVVDSSGTGTTDPEDPTETTTSWDETRPVLPTETTTTTKSESTTESTTTKSDSSTESTTAKTDSSTESTTTKSDSSTESTTTKSDSSTESTTAKTDGSTETTTEQSGGSGGTTAWNKVKFAKSEFTFKWTGKAIPVPQLQNVPEGLHVDYTIQNSSGTNVDSMIARGTYNVIAVFDADGVPTQRIAKVTISVVAPEGGFDDPTATETTTETTTQSGNTDNSTETTTSKSGSSDDSTETTTSKSGNTDNSTETTTSQSGNTDNSTETTTSQSGGGSSGSTTDWNKVKFAKSAFTFKWTGSAIPAPQLQNVPAGVDVAYAIQNSKGTNVDVMIARDTYTVIATFDADGTPMQRTAKVTVTVSKPEEGFDDPTEATTSDSDTETTTESPAGGSTDVKWSAVDFTKHNFTFKWTGTTIPTPRLKNVPDGTNIDYVIQNSNGTNIDSMISRGTYNVIATFDADGTPVQRVATVTITVVTPSGGYDDPNATEATTSAEGSTEATTASTDPNTEETSREIADGDWVVDDDSEPVKGDMSDPDWSWSKVKFPAPLIAHEYDSSNPQPHQPYLQNLPDGYNVMYYIKNRKGYVTKPIQIGTYYVVARIVPKSGSDPVPSEYVVHSCNYRITGRDLSANPTITDIMQGLYFIDEYGKPIAVDTTGDIYGGIDPELYMTLTVGQMSEELGVTDEESAEDIKEELKDMTDKEAKELIGDDEEETTSNTTSDDTTEATTSDDTTEVTTSDTTSDDTTESTTSDNDSITTSEPTDDNTTGNAADNDNSTVSDTTDDDTSDNDATITSDNDKTITSDDTTIASDNDATITSDDTSDNDTTSDTSDNGTSDNTTSDTSDSGSSDTSDSGSSDSTSADSGSDGGSSNSSSEA